MNSIGSWMSLSGKIAVAFAKIMRLKTLLYLDIAVSLLKQEKTAKGGIHAKQLQAAWNEDYLLTVLSG